MTFFRCIEGNGPLTSTVNSLNPLGFTSAARALFGTVLAMQVPVAPAEIPVLHGAVLSEGTPEWIRTLWLDKRELWLPRDWCLEWAPETV